METLYCPHSKDCLFKNKLSLYYPSKGEAGFPYHQDSIEKDKDGRYLCGVLSIMNEYQKKRPLEENDFAVCSHIEKLNLLRKLVGNEKL